MEGIDEATAASAIRIKIGDHEVTAKIPSMRAMGHLRACLSQLPRPHDIQKLKAEYAGLPEPVVNGLLTEAGQANLNWPPSILGGLINFIDVPGLYADFLVAALEGDYPGITLKNIPESRQVADGLLDIIDFQAYITLVEVAFEVKLRGDKDNRGDQGDAGEAKAEGADPKGSP